MKILIQIFYLLKKLPCPTIQEPLSQSLSHHLSWDQGSFTTASSHSHSHTRFPIFEFLKIMSSWCNNYLELVPPRRHPKQRNLWVFIPSQSRSGKIWSHHLLPCASPGWATGPLALGCANGLQFTASCLGLKLLLLQSSTCSSTLAAPQETLTKCVPQHIPIIQTTRRTQMCQGEFHRVRDKHSWDISTIQSALKCGLLLSDFFQ